MSSLPYTVLIVDDSLEDRLAFRRFLERDQDTRYTCYEAATAAEALAHCRERCPDAVVLDYQLPDDDGLTLLAALIHAHGLYAFAIVLLTGVGSEQVAVAAMKLGAHDYLIKNANLEQQLGHAVASAIEKAGFQREVAWHRREQEISNAQLQQALATLSAERVLLNVTLASISDAVITTDTQGRITFLNAEAERLTGWLCAEAVGQPLTAVFRIINAHTRMPGEDSAAKVLHSGKMVEHASHTILIARDGHEMPIDDSSSLMRQADGVVAGVVLVFRNMSFQKQAQAALRESEERLHIVTETAQVGLVIVDQQQRYRYANRAYADIFRLPSADLIGLRVADVLASAYEVQIRPRLECAFGGERVNYELTLPSVAPDTQPRFYAVTYEPGIYRSEKVVIVVVVEITERKQAEVALQRHAERLRVLADASHAFAAAGTDYQTVLDQIARVAAEQLGACCIIRTLSDDAQWLQAVTIYDRDPAVQEVVQKTFFHTSVHVADLNPIAVVVRSGQPQLVSVTDPEEMRAAMHPDLWPTFARFFPHSSVLTPLRVRGHTIGSLSFMRHEPGQPAFTADDLTLAQDIADRAALAISNARLYQDVQTELERRREAEVQLRYQADLLDQVSDAIISTDANFRIKSWNAAAEALYGWQAHEAIGRPMNEILPTTYLDSDLQQSHAILIERGGWQGEVIQPHRDGSTRTILSSTSLLKDSAGKFIGVVGINHDITERKRAEAVLQRYTDRLQHLRAIDQLILASHSLTEIAEAVVNHIGHLMPITRVSVMLVDLDTRTLTSLMLRVRDHIQPTGVQAPLESLGMALEMLMQGQVYYVADIAVLAVLPKSFQVGQVEQVHTYFCTPIMANGKLIALLNVGSDQVGSFTAEHIEIAREVADQLSIALQQAHLHAQVERYAQELEQRVVARTAELAAANKELEAFSYSVSHDLRAPLRAIDGFSRILLEDYAAQLPDEAQHYFRLVRDNTLQMGRLIDDLLDFARLSRQSLNLRLIEPATLIRACLAELQDQQVGREIELHVDDLPDCLGDPALLKQVWINLLANALKYTRRRNPAVIVITSRVEGGETIYCVKDNGVGFDMRYSDKLFDVFQRMHRAEDYEGTGVGLAIVQRIIHRHGGRIWAEAAIDQGATFFFTLGQGSTIHDSDTASAVLNLV